MTLELFGMTGIKLYISMIVGFLLVCGGSYMLVDSMSEPYALSGDEDDTFSVGYVDEGKSYVSFTSSPSGASVKIDDTTYTTPTGEISIVPGSYQYSMSLEGYVTKLDQVSVEDGKSKALNVVLEGAPEQEAEETPTPDGTPESTPDGTPDGTPEDGTPTPTPTEQYPIPWGAVDMKFVVGTAFQGVESRGGHSADLWNEVEGKTLYLRDKNTIELSQTSGYPGGVGDTLIEYEDEVPTGLMEFEHYQTYGSPIDWRLTYTGDEDNGFVSVANILAGSVDAPNQAGPLSVKINVVPKSYGFWFDVEKEDSGPPTIVDNRASPAAIYASSWTLASLAFWDRMSDPLITVHTGSSQGALTTKYELHTWMFWKPVIDSSNNLIEGQESFTRVVVSAKNAANFDRTGTDKVLYITLRDVYILSTSDDLPYISEYKITYDVDLGNIENVRVTKLS